MNLERVNKLEEYMKEDPGDPFVIYALATEWFDADIQKSKVYFDMLLHDHVDYVGTYYHAARLYLLLNDAVRAKEIFKKGIAVAKETGDLHALSEIQTAYNAFLYDEE